MNFILRVPNRACIFKHSLTKGVKTLLALIIIPTIHMIPTGSRRDTLKLMICSVLWVTFFLFGMCIGAPTVYIPQIRREANSTEVITDSMAALLIAIYGYSGIPWVFILPAAAAFFGRKRPFIFVFIGVVFAVITFYTSTTYTQLLISHAMEGVLGAAIITISSMVMTEYTSPKYRGFFLTFKSATFTWGIWMSNAIGMFFHWKTIGMMKVILSIYPLLLVFFWPESPLWLASKGRLQECIKTHRWLNGRNENSEQDLQRLLSQNRASESRVNERVSFRIFLEKDFYKATLLCMCILCMHSLSGKIAVGYYSIDIIKKMTSSESTAYNGMLILDGITVLGMYAGTVVSRFVKRRTLFLVSSYVGIAALYVLALYIYLVNLTKLPENKYVSITLLSVYSLGLGIGPMILCSSMCAELLPLKCRSLAICMVALSDRLAFSMITHLTPTFIKCLGLHSAFLFFGLSSSFCIVILYHFLPETKDKSLHEIADAIAGGKVQEERINLTLDENSKEKLQPKV